MNVCYFWDIPDASEISSLSKSPALNPVYLEKAGACLWLAWLLCERMKWQSGLFQDLSPFRLTSCLFDSVLGSDHWELLTPCLGQDALLVSKPPTWLSLKLLQVYALLALLAVVILLGFPSSSAAMQETWVQLLGWEDPWVGRRARPPTPVFFGFPGGSLVKNLPAMWETWVQSLGWEDPLEKRMATHSSVLPGKSHGQRYLVGYSP